MDLASGLDHSVLALTNGQVFGWGNGRKGQLGEPAEVVWRPREIRNLKFPVVRVVCGREFTYLVGREGRHAILGSGKYNVKAQENATIPDFPPKDIGSSWGSIYVLDTFGRLNSWGRNDHGQLGPPDLPDIKQIAAGSEHVVALTKETSTQNSKVISWGWGEHGNCGAELDENGDVTRGKWNEIPTQHPALGVGAGCATSFFWTNY